jgi:hypothetical protein
MTRNVFFLTFLFTSFCFGMLFTSMPIYIIIICMFCLLGIELPVYRIKTAILQNVFLAYNLRN